MLFCLDDACNENRSCSTKRSEYVTAVDSGTLFSLDDTMTLSLGKEIEKLVHSEQRPQFHPCFEAT